MAESRSYRVEWQSPASRWLEGVKDLRTQTIIARRIDRLEFGLFGHTRDLGQKLQELKIDYGPGYRVYFTIRGRELIVLLCGGDKSSQRSDIV